MTNKTMLDIVSANDQGSMIIRHKKDEDTVNVKYKVVNLDIENDSVPVDNLPAVSDVPMASGWLPPMIRWMSKKRDIVVFERSPELRKVQCIPLKKYSVEDGNTDGEYEVSLLIPWQVYVVILNPDGVPINVGVFARPSALTSLADSVYTMPLPNLYSNGKVCLPVLDSISQMQIFSIGDAVQTAYQMFWSSGFNYDLTNCITMCRNGGFVRGVDNNVAADDQVKAFLRLWEDYVTSLNDFNFVNPTESDITINGDDNELPLWRAATRLYSEVNYSSSTTRGQRLYNALSTVANS